MDIVPKKNINDFKIEPSKMHFEDNHYKMYVELSKIVMENLIVKLWRGRAFGVGLGKDLGCRRVGGIDGGMYVLLW